ncbi:MAG: methylmalonyl-CoA mutase family protein [Candidatus Edwardsbacteria bacterium]
MKKELLYLPDDVRDLDYQRDLGFPGDYPFTRGIYSTMYRGKLWTMRQYSGYAAAEESNRRYKYLLQQGQTGLSVAFDLPTQMGYNSDHPMASGEVGKTGVAIDSLEDMERLFKGILLDKVSTSMTINATAAVLLGMYVAVAEKQGVKPETLEGTIQNDILKEYIARGTYIFPPEPSLRLTTDIFAYCGKHLPKWNTISISGYHIREAGSTAVQEIAFTLANAIAYVQSARQAGLNIDDFAPRLSFFFNAHNNLFEEIAKFRAARRLWARIMKEKFEAQNPRSWMLRFHTQTAGCTLTAQQSENNAVRVTLQALAAVLGGTQSLHTNAKDEALALPSEESVKLALRTQQIIGYETKVTETIDPLGGSYYLEWLTAHLEEKAKKYLEEIENLGGALKAIETGFYQKEIQKSAYECQKKIEEKKEIIVGVNEFIEAEKEKHFKILKVNPQVAKRQILRLKRLKQRRNNLKVKQSLENLKRTAKGKENLMLPIIEAVKCYATIGEICDILKEVFGEYKEKVVF